MNRFYNLHLHTNPGSPYDALGAPKEWVEAAIAKGIDAMAVTEHGNMNSLAEFVLTVQEKEKAGIPFKPIYGVEFYVIKSIDKWLEMKAQHEAFTSSKKKGVNPIPIADIRATSHLVVWAKNAVGLRNLYHMVSMSHRPPYFYRKPRIDLKMLTEHSEGLMACNACMGGVLGSVVRRMSDMGKDEFSIRRSVDELNSWFKDLFGDGWYNEVQWNGFQDQHRLNKYVLSSASRLQIPVITTVDSHYISPALWKHREFYYAMKYLRGEEEEKMDLPESFEATQMDLSLKDFDGAWSDYKRFSANAGYDDAEILQTLERTQEVVEKIEKFYPDQSPKMPNFIMEQYSEDPIEEIRKICSSELSKRVLDNDVYRNRLSTELNVIKTRGFGRYFLTMREIVGKASAHWATGAARGSAAGSLVSYLLDITQVDPVRFNLSFSRFLTMDAIGYPDIDFDVADPAGLKQMLIQEWGEEKLAFVSNWNLLKFKNLVKDIGKFFDIPFFEVNEMTKASEKEAIEGILESGVDIPKVYSPSYEEIKTHSVSAQRFFKKYPIVEEYIEVLSGQVRDVSTHAGGVIIGDDLSWEMPMISVKDKWQTPWPEGQNKRMLEPMGFIKFDILGISTLQVIQRAIEKILKSEGKPSDFDSVRKWYSKNLHPESINFDDKKVYDYVFRDGHWAGVFQFSQEGAQKFCKNAEPKSLNDLAIITSIYRPGPLGAGVDKLFLSRKNGQEEDEYTIDHPIFNDVTKDTYGFIIFQEQISELVSRMGEGISEDDGQKVRKLLTKKKGGDMEKLKPYIEKYYEGCDNKKIPRSISEKVWDNCVHFAAYGFNRAHGLSYSMISYQSAYLATYYPDLWIESLLDVEYELKGEGLIQELRKSNYQIVNLSEAGWKSGDWRCDKGKIYPPVWVMNGVSKDFAKKLSEQEFEKLVDVWRFFVQEREKKLLVTFVACGVFDSLMSGLSREGFIKLISEYKGQIYSQPHLEESVGMVAMGLEKTDELDDAVRYMNITGILPVERVYPKAVLQEAVTNNIMPPSRIMLAEPSKFSSNSVYLVFVAEIVMKDKWGKLIYVDETGQREEVYVNNYSVLRDIISGRMYVISLKRESRTSIKIARVMPL